MKRITLSIILATVWLGAYAQELNIGSYNIRVANTVDPKHKNGWEDRRDILCDLIRFENFDAFGAQEVTYPQLCDMLERLPDYSYVGVGRDDGKDKGEFSPVFYNTKRFQLLTSGTFWLSETPEEVSMGWDAVCRRVCSYALLKDRKTKQQFWFFNTHMDHIGVVARREGAKLILAKIHELTGDKSNIVVTGDFNVDQFSEAHATILSTGRLQDSYAIAGTRFAPGCTFNSWDVNVFSEKRIDHIFVSTGTSVSRYGILTYHYWEGEKRADSELQSAPRELTAEQRNPHMPSDHYPINAWISFPRKK